MFLETQVVDIIGCLIMSAIALGPPATSVASDDMMTLLRVRVVKLSAASTLW